MNSQKPHYSLLPKFITTLQEGYNWRTFLQDLNSGVIVGIVALPLAIAFAIASGATPMQGLYTAIIAGFLISLLGGSRFQIGGPTGAFVVVVYNIIHRYGYDGLVMATVLAGLILVVIGLLRVGSFIKFIPYPVTIGFTAGIAVIIAVSQVKDFLGLPLGALPVEFFEKVMLYGHNLTHVNGWAAGIGLLSLILLVVWPRLVPKVPASLIVILLSTFLVQYFKLPVETIGSKFGSVAAHLPGFHLPHVDWQTVRQLFAPAMTIALLAGIESLLSAVVADGMTGRRHRSNAEILAQGVANVVAVCFHGIPATGAIARTATNIKNGGQTPVAGMIHAVTLLIILLAAGKWAAMIPLASLAAILLMVAYQMSEWKVLKSLWRYPKSDIVVLLITFGLTVVIDLTVAIQVGIVLSMFLLMNRMSNVTQAGFITNALKEDDPEHDQHAVKDRQVPAGVEVFEINGVFFFGAVDLFKSALSGQQKKPAVFILRLRQVISIDAAALKALEELLEKFRREGTSLILSGVHAQPLHAMDKAGVLEKIGRENVTPNIDAALARARVLLAPTLVD